MNFLKTIRTSALVAAALAASVTVGSAQVTNFSTDTGAAIDAGLAWLDGQGVFVSSNSPATDAAGLVVLALLEKRVSVSQGSPAQGYVGATPADQVRIENLITYIINDHTNAVQYAYRDGGDLMALSVYLRTGGPNQAGAQASMNTMFDRTIAAQNAAGYWCYGAIYGFQCNDSSTTQLVMAGLSAARGVYSDPAYLDAGRLNQLNAAASAARDAYKANGLDGESCSPGNILSNTERGHGYNQGDCNSLQQTASGTWIQVVGGSDLNDPGVQSYLEWIRNRYRYTDIAANDWSSLSAYYYMWSSSKAYEFLEQSGVMPGIGNLTPNDLGLLPAANAPAYGLREVHRNPAADVRVPQRGAGGAGYYASPFEPARWYYDYAYTLMTHQNGGGQFVSPSGGWDSYSNQAYALLVLERSIGGGCSDGDQDGACDVADNCPTISNAGQQDGDNDAIGDACDNCAAVANGSQSDINNNGIGDACDPGTVKIKLNVATAPGSGKANVTLVNLTGSGFPAGAILPANVDVALSATCLGTPLATTKATTVQVLAGSSRKIQFKIPAGLPAGPYKVFATGVVGGNAFASTTCSALTIVP